MRNACITLSLHPSLLLSQLKITNTKQQFLLKIVVWTEVAESISTQNSDDLFLLREKILEGKEKKLKSHYTTYLLFLLAILISKIRCESQPKTRTENLVRNNLECN